MSEGYASLLSSYKESHISFSLRTVLLRNCTELGQRKCHSEGPTNFNIDCNIAVGTSQKKSLPLTGFVLQMELIFF